MKVRDFSSDLTVKSNADDRTSPKVSIILPTYARAHSSLPKAIESVLSQSFGDFEFIIVDDGSRDGTADVLAEYARVDSRIVVHTYRGNSGLPALRVNQAALRSRGRYIGYQFDDDYWTEDSLRLRVSELEKIDQLAVVYGNSRVSFGSDRHLEPYILGRAFNFAALAQKNFIPNNTVLHHRGLFDVAGMYDPHIVFRRYSDYDLWLRFSRYAKFVWIDETISHVDANLINSLGREIRHFHTLYRKMISVQRDRLLTPGAIGSYDVIDIAPFADRLTDDEVENYRRNIVVPFLSGFNDYCSADELNVAASMRGRRLNLLTVKPDYSTSVDVTINNFVNLPFQRALANAFVPERELTVVDLKSMDIAILYRTMGAHASALVARGEIPTAYSMDDNMLHFHEVGPEHHHLAPGTSAHRDIVHQISNADACIGYSDSIVEDLRELNSRTIQLAANIPRKFIQSRDYRRGRRLRIAILSGPVRAQILASLWPALADFADRHPGEVEMHFWGIEPANCGQLSCEVYFKPFDHNYQSYLNSLLETSFDVVLVPLDHSTRAARSKSPVKLLEAVAAGAICIFSDAEPYASLPDDCCLKAPNTVEAWSAALEASVAMGAAGRMTLLERARSLVAEKYETESRFYDFLAAYDAVKLHATLKDKAIAYGFHEAALGGATLHLLQHARMARSLGFDVVGIVPADGLHLESFRDRWDEATSNASLVTAHWPPSYVDTTVRGQFLERPASGEDRKAADEVAAMLKSANVGLLHFATWSPTMSLLGKALGVPSVASVHQFYSGGGRSVIEFVDAIHCSSLAHGVKWESAARIPVRRMVCPADDEYFHAFQANRRRAALAAAPFRILVSGTLQQRKNQLAVIQAIGKLRSQGHDIVADFIGYTEFDPEYVSRCRNAIEENGLDQSVRLHGFVDNPRPFYNRADLLVVAAFDESMPQTIIQAMAGGVPVASTKVGGVKEIVRHRYTGVLIEGQSPDEIASAILEWLVLSVDQRLEMLDRAHRVAEFLARPSYVKFELICLYNEAAQRSRQKNVDAVSAAANPAPQEDVSPQIAAHGLLRRNLLNAKARKEIADIKRYTKTHFQRSFGRKVVPGEDLRSVSYREYAIPFRVERLNSVSLVAGPVGVSTAASIGIEIVTQSQEIVGHVVLPVLLNSHDVPVHFSLPAPLEDLEEGWRLRVFTKDIDVAVFTYEVSGRVARFGGERYRVPLVRFR